MASLTNTNKKTIFENGGKISEDEKVITFDKRMHKPSSKCKRLLRELGYEITNRSGAKFSLDMEYVLRE